VERVLERLSSLMDVDIGEGVLGKIWSGDPALQDYGDPQDYPPEEELLVPLVDHAIETAYYPVIEPIWQSLSLGTLEFEISLELLLEGVILTVQGGKILEARLGSCVASGSLRWGALIILAKESEAIEFPGTVQFAQPLPLKPQDAPQASDAAKN